MTMVAGKFSVVAVRKMADKHRSGIFRDYQTAEMLTELARILDRTEKPMFDYTKPKMFRHKNKWYCRGMFLINKPSPRPAACYPVNGEGYSAQEAFCNWANNLNKVMPS